MSDVEEEKTNHRYLSLFLDVQKGELGASENTCLAYGRDLKDFSNWLNNKTKKNFVTLTQENIESYLIYCEQIGLSQATRARRLSSIKQLMRFMYDEKERDDNPSTKIKGAGSIRRLPQTLSKEQILKLIEAARIHGNTPSERQRNSTIFELFYASGLRVSELAELHVSAVKGNPRMILIRGKGAKERMVPLSEPAREAIKQWLHIRNKQEEIALKSGKKASAYLFPTPQGDGHISRQHIHLLFKKIALKAGIPPSNVSPHKLRHAFATHLLKGGADLRVIQTLLGHSDLSSTEIYTQVLDEHLKELVLTKHPLAK